jgi:hypothetical protein
MYLEPEQHVVGHHRVEDLDGTTANVPVSNDSSQDGCWLYGSVGDMHISKAGGWDGILCYRTWPAWQPNSCEGGTVCADRSIWPSTCCTCAQGFPKTSIQAKTGQVIGESKEILGGWFKQRVSKSHQPRTHFALA